MTEVSRIHRAVAVSFWGICSTTPISIDAVEVKSHRVAQAMDSENQSMRATALLHRVRFGTFNSGDDAVIAAAALQVCEAIVNVEG